ncbi:MAG: BrnT family toxin [Methylobacter sp.]|nr:BrnT family toxin [Methylobacter sp.]MDI1358927.1 BrnT family toxin [Methylobacter sp.]
MNEQMLLVVHTFRYDDVIRMISARKATATEAATYMKRACKMKEEYDFSNAEQGKFYVSVEDIQLPIYLDKDVIQYLNEKCQITQGNLQLLVNDLLRKDIEIAKRVAS